MANGTGTGGFNIGGKAQFYDVGVEREDESSIPYDPGDVSVDGRPRDISNGTKKTLASYLSKVTLGQEGIGTTPRQPNAYPIDPDTASVSLLDEKGNTSPLVTGGHNTKKFAYDGPSMRSRSNDIANLESQVRRGLSAASGPSPLTGHTLLSSGMGSVLNEDAEPFDHSRQAATLGESPLGLYTKTLLSKNRFTPFTSTAAGTNDVNPSTYADMSSPQSVDQQLNPQRFIHGYKKGSSKVPSEALRISFGQLSQIGTNLMVRTTNELGSNRDGYSPSTSSAESNAALPTYQQLGIKRIEMALLEGKSVLEALPFTGIKSEQVTNFGNLSWGALNNALDQYSGFSSFGMQLLSVALVSAALLTINIFGAVIGRLFKSMTLPAAAGQNGQSGRRDALGRLPIGSSTPKGGFIDASSPGGLLKVVLSGGANFAQLFGVLPTNKDFFDCVKTGSLAFFGIDGSTAADVIKNSLSLSQQPGYVSVMARSFNRSFLKIADDMKGLVDVFKANLASGIKKLFDLINSFQQSRFIKSLNVFASLGDAILTYLGEDDVKDVVASSKGFGAKVSRIDAYKNDPGFAHFKNRLAGVSTPMTAWATATAKSLLILPQFYSGQEGDNLGRPKFNLQQLPLKDKNGQGEFLYEDPYRYSKTSRLSDDDRDELEDRLESEYLPFYITDLRTNEVVSFHAFLASLTDGYSATYDSTDGFGRIEPVKMYKNTTRKLDFSFYMASMNPTDLDYMWAKINKLTTIVYPQYTSGKEVVTKTGGKEYRLTVPFSQNIAAPPMVRVRIGDLIQSNYSKFNLARLFGYADERTNFGAPIAELSPDEEKSINQRAADMRNNGILIGYTYYLEGTSVLDDGAFALDTSFGTYNITNRAKPNIKYTLDGHSLPAGIVLKVIDIHFRNPLANNDEYADKSFLIAEFVVDKDELNGKSESDLYKEFRDNKNEKRNIIGKTFLFSNINAFMQTKKTVARIAANLKKQALSNKKPTGLPGTSSDFMDEKNNPVVKSFRTVGGKGLAGFVESLNFEWYDRTQWNVDATQSRNLIGRRVPTMCKVTVSFSPIHDISPGIDHKGFNRAPIYPVAGMAHAKRKA